MKKGINNERTGQLYSSKFRISVVDLAKRNLATKEDIAHHRDLLAAFFKATEWGEVMALAEKDKNISEAAVTLRKLSDDELFKMRYELVRICCVRSWICSITTLTNSMRKMLSLLTKINSYKNLKDNSLKPNLSN